MTRALFRSLLFALLALPLALPAYAEGHPHNYYVHYECVPENNFVEVKTYIADMPMNQRPRTDMVFDVLASAQRIFLCPLSSGDRVYFETIYGAPKGKYGHISVSVNNVLLTQTIEFNPDHAETIQVKDQGAHNIDVRYLAEFDEDTSPQALAKKEFLAQAEDADGTKKLHDENVEIASRRPPGVYGWGVLYTHFTAFVPPSRAHQDVGSYNWGSNGVGFKDNASGNYLGPYGWGVNYLPYHERDPQYGLGPWGWGPQTIGLDKDVVVGKPQSP